MTSSVSVSEMARTSSLSQPLVPRSGLVRRSRPITLDRDGVLYSEERPPEQDLSRRRQVIPESTEGRTPHLVVASRSLDSTLPDTVYTDFKLVSKGEVTQGFRYWQDDQSQTCMSSTEGEGSSMARYIQVVTLNSWSNKLASTVGNLILTAISKYANITFISTTVLDSEASQALAVLFLLNIFYQLYASFTGAREFWDRHTRVTGDLVLRDGCDESLCPGDDSNWQLSKMQKLHVFLSLWMTEFFMVPRTLREAPIVFHNWKGAGEFASIKAEGARIHFVGHVTEAAFQTGENGSYRNFRRQVVSALSDTGQAGLKFYLAQMRQNQGTFFNILTIFLPLAVTAYRCYQLYRARKAFENTLVSQIRRGSDDDPNTKTAQLLRILFFPKDSSEAHRMMNAGARVQGYAASVRKFAYRFKSRLERLSIDLQLAERKLNVGQLCEFLEPLRAQLNYFTEDPVEDEDIPTAVERVKRSVIGDGVCICILGSQEFNSADSQELVKSLALRLADSALAGKATFITGGMDGVQKTFADNFGDGYRLWNLSPIGQNSGFANGRDLHAGADSEQRKCIFAQLGDIYITVEGGKGVADEARMACERGACIIPLMRTGGASSGMYDFPSAAFEKPEQVTEAHWALLANREASIQDSALAAAAITMLLATSKPFWQAENKLPAYHDMAAGTARSLVALERYPNEGATTDASTSRGDAHLPEVHRHSTEPEHFH